MRILYVVTAAGFGGAPMHVLQLLRHFSAQGHVIGLVSAPEPRLVDEAKRLGVQVYPNPYFVRTLNPIADLRALQYVIQSIKRFQPDILHAHSSKAGLAARFGAAFYGVQAVVFTAHGWAFTEGRPMWKRRIIALVERIAAYKTSRIICVSNHDYNLALAFHVAPVEKLRVVHNGVDPSPFLQPSPGDVRKSLGLREDDVVITFVGRLAPPKDALTLLAAIKNVPSCKVLIVGDGPLRDGIEAYSREQKLSESVIMLGERSDVPAILSASDIFVLISDWEGLPYTIIEAMMAGLPVIASEVGGVGELVKDGETGFLVERKDVAGLTAALQRLIGNRALRQKLGNAGRQRALTMFSAAQMLKNVQDVYAEL